MWTKPRTWPLLFVSVWSVLLSARASAQQQRESASSTHADQAAREPALRMAVYVDGPGADALRSKILTLVPLGVDVADEEALPKAFVAAHGGRRGSLGEATGATKRRDELLESIHRAADTIGIQAVVVGRLHTTKRGERELRLVGIDACSTAPTLERRVALSSDGATQTLRAAFGNWLDDVELRNGVARLTLSGTTSEDGGAAIDGAPVAAEKPASPPSGAERDGSTGLFELGAGIEVWTRSFTYSDPLPAAATRQRSYDVPGALAAVVSGSVYPLATSGLPVLRDVGVTGELARDLGIDSEPAPAEGRLERGTTIASSYGRYRVGMRGRIRLGDNRAPIIGVKAGYGFVSFAFDSPPPPYDAALPAVSYSLLTGGVDARVPFSRFAAVASAEYLAPLAVGGVGGRFRHTSMGGIDARVGLSAPVTNSIEARLIGGYARYFYSFAPRVGDAYVAGGALDQYVSISLGAAYVH